MKWSMFTLAGLLLLTLVMLVIAGSSVPSAGASTPSGDESRIQIGFAIAPVHLNLERKNRALVGLGSYIVNSRNITPDADTGLPAELTFDQFRLVIRTGVDLEHEHPQFGPLLQVMPWPIYQSMTDRDLRAIYEYLGSIPHAEPGSCTGAGQ